MPSTLRVAVLGLGIGKHHVRDFLVCDDVDVVAACDVNEKELEYARQKWGIEHLYTDYRRLLSEQKPDAIAIALPNYLHEPVTIEALRAGCHVLCEKPMALNTEGAQRMRDASRETDRTLMINFNRRFHASAAAAKRFCEGGRLGHIYFARSVWHRRRGFPGFGGWFGTKSQSGGGALIDLGIHRLDLALWLMGYPQPVTVSAATYSFLGKSRADLEKKLFDVEDLATAYIRFSNGSTLVLEASWALNQREADLMTTHIYGTQGGLLEKNLNETYEFDAFAYTEENGVLIDHHLKQLSTREQLPQEHFVDCIRNHTTPGPSAEHGLLIMKILDTIYASAKAGREIEIDLSSSPAAESLQGMTVAS